MGTEMAEHSVGRQVEDLIDPHPTEMMESNGNIDAVPTRARRLSPLLHQ